MPIQKAPIRSSIFSSDLTLEFILVREGNLANDISKNDPYWCIIAIAV
jgi:hypothetical protein